NDTVMNRALATQGILTVAIDFRQPPEAGYPASVCDMNLAIRWLKVHASEYGGTDKVGALGVSSGGHLVLLGGIRPRDARYSALPLAGHDGLDASLAYVVACWPVSDPLYRYGKAQAAGNASIVKSHDAYWGSEAATLKCRCSTRSRRHSRSATSFRKRRPSSIPSRILFSASPDGSPLTTRH